MLLLAYASPPPQLARSRSPTRHLHPHISQVVAQMSDNITIEMWYVMCRGLIVSMAQATVTLSHLEKGQATLCFWTKYLPIKLGLGIFGSLIVRKLLTDLFLVRTMAFGLVPLTTFFDAGYGTPALADHVTVIDCLNGVADESVCMTMHENATLMSALSGHIIAEKSLILHFWPWSHPEVEVSI